METPNYSFIPKVVVKENTSNGAGFYKTSKNLKPIQELGEVEFEYSPPKNN